MKISASSRKTKSFRRRNHVRCRAVAAEWLEERLLLSSTLGEAPCAPQGNDVAGGPVGDNDQPADEAGVCQSREALAELNFVPDPGVRVELGAVPEVGLDQETGEVYLYYSVGPDPYLARSDNGGLEFSAPEASTDMAHDPRGVLMPHPDDDGNPIWRRIRWDISVGAFTSMASSDGANFSPEDGFRYDPADTENVGVYTVFNTSDGRVGLMYIGDKGMTTANVRLAYSTDNGQSFQLEYDNPLDDAGTHDEGLNQRDPAANLLDDGRIRVFTMVQGGTEAPLPGVRTVTSIFSFTSSDDGHSFEADPGQRLSPEDFTEFDVWSLNDPSVIQLPDGRYRMYIAGLVSEEPDASDVHWAILSATTQSPDDPETGGEIPRLQGPTGTINDPTPEFHWSAVDTVESYEFQVVRGPDGHPGQPSEPGEFTVEEFEDGSVECRPVGEGPFPAVLYNHGGLGGAVGGDLLGTCVALAEAGFFARSELRPASVSLDGQLEDVLSGLDKLRDNPDVDSEKIAIAGFSRGGLLALQATAERPAEVDSVLLFAPAPGHGAMTQLLEDVSAIESPVQILIAENDDLLPLAQDVQGALADAGADVELKVYPPYGNDGHELFFKVRESYWSDVLDTLGGDNVASTEIFESTVDHPGEAGLADGERVVFQAVLSDTSVTVPELVAGNYMAHVRAVDGAGGTTRWSHPLKFTVSDGVMATSPVDVRFDRDTGHLSLRLEEAAIIRLQADDGFVQVLVDGVPLHRRLSLSAEAVRSLSVLGSPGDDSIDLDGATREVFPHLARVHVNGGDGNDVIIGSDGHDMLAGGNGDDYLNGKRGDDRLVGGPGNDTLAGGAGADALSGGLGDDVLNGHAGIDILVEEGNNDFVLNHRSLRGLGEDRLGHVEQARLAGGDDGNRIDASAFEGSVTISGGGGDDVLVGGSGDDLLDGGPGHDRLNGRGGDDVLNGHDDDDRVIGGGGDDRLSGGRGDDHLKGQGGSDLLSEVGDIDFELTDDRLDGHGRDRLSGIERARLEGGAGDNSIDARKFSGATTLLGAAGNDLLRGGHAYDRIDGGEGDDRIAGFGGNDLMVGRQGRDILIGGHGDDRIFGGADNDVILGGEGHDRVHGQGGSHDTLVGGGGDDRMGGDAREIDEAFQFVADWIDEA